MIDGNCGWAWALGCDGNGRLVVMEHEAGIEQVVGLRLGPGHGCGSGRGFGPGY